MPNQQEFTRIDRSLILEYEELLIGNRRTLNQEFFVYGEYTNELMALEIMKYAFSTYLRWSEYELRDRISLKLLKMLKLDGLLRLIRFPPELNPQKDYFYIVWRLYPNTVNYSYEERVYRVYKDVLEGNIAKFPKEYFSGADGRNRAILCFRYALEHISPFNSVREMYAHFGSAAGGKTLKQAKLFVVGGDLFGTPLDYLHASLPLQQRNRLMYGEQKFKIKLAEARRKYNAEKRSKREESNIKQ